MLPDHSGVISLDSVVLCRINGLLVLLKAWFCSASSAAEASKQVEHKRHSMYTSESWRTLVFPKAVIHFVGTDDDGREKEIESEGGVDLLVERAIQWLESVLHHLVNEAEKTFKPGGYFPSFWLKLSCFSRPFGAIERFKWCNKKWEMMCYLNVNEFVLILYFWIKCNHTWLTSDIEKLPGAVTDTTVLWFLWDILYRLLRGSSILPSVMPHCIPEKLKSLWALASASGQRPSSTA